MYPFSLLPVGVMSWPGIIGKELLGLYRMPEGVKLTSKTYKQFLKYNLLPWLDDLSLSH